MLDSINKHLFSLINAPDFTSDFMKNIGIAAAEYPLYLVALLMVGGWVWGSLPQRRALFNAGVAAVLGLLVNTLIHSVWYQPQPFTLGYGQQLLAHSIGASFPSDHGTVMFSVAFALLLSKSRLGIIALLAALLTGWARIFVGVHWPIDILGAIAVALIAAPLASTLLPKPITALFKVAHAAYLWLLNILHLPAKFFPR